MAILQICLMIVAGVTGLAFIGLALFAFYHAKRQPNTDIARTMHEWAAKDLSKAILCFMVAGFFALAYFGPRVVIERSQQFIRMGE
jgi:hypothetical protein